MNHENLINIAKTANEKGFKPNTLTTKATNDYLIGGKNLLVNDTCLYLWMCEVQMWLLKKYNLLVNIYPYFGTEYDEGIQGWDLLSICNIDTEQRYPLKNRFETIEDTIQVGILESLKLI